jgi:hypothetical protein
MQPWGVLNSRLGKQIRWLAWQKNLELYESCVEVIRVSFLLQYNILIFIWELDNTNKFQLQLDDNIQL